MSERTRFASGDAAFTRLVKKLSREMGLDVETHERWNGYGRAVSGYTADAAVVEKARATLAAKRDAADQERRREEERREEERRRAWADEIASAYPYLHPQPSYGTLIHDGWGAVPLHLYSRSQWRRLGYRILADAQPRGLCCLHGGKIAVPLYGSAQTTVIRSRYSGLEPAALWTRYQEMGLGLVHAVWAANKLQKIAPQDKRHFYMLKDKFLCAHQDRLIEGRVARHEVRSCWSCLDDHIRDCWKCGGTGVYSSRTLYEHLLELEGRVWSFHSYERPREVSDTPAADLKVYGKRFGPQDRIPYRLLDYIRMIEYRITRTDTQTTSPGRLHVEC